MHHDYVFGSFVRVWVRLNETLQSVPGNAGREHLIGVSNTRSCGVVQKLNAVYGKRFQSLNELRQRGGIMCAAGDAQKFVNESIAADEKDLLAKNAEQVHKLAHTEIRKVDSNQKVLGCCVKGSTYAGETWKRTVILGRNQVQY